MPTVILSKLSYSRGEAIAQGAASQLGYQCIEEEVFQDASHRSQIPLDDLHKAFYETRSFFGMSLATRKRCVAHVQAALAARLLDDNTVFQGPYGHLMIRGVTHVLNVRVIAPKQDRIALKVKQEGCDSKEAEKAISRQDKQRLSIARDVFGVDDDDNGAFNLVIDTSQTDVDAAVGSVVQTVKQDRYKPMTYSQQFMENLELSCRVRASIVDLDPDVAVQAKKGAVQIRTRATRRGKEKQLNEITARVEKQDGVKSLEVEAVTALPDMIERRTR